MSEFQPPDIEEDRETMMEAWFDQQEKCGMVVASREELQARIDTECTEAYAEGRKDERDDAFKRLIPLLKELHESEYLSEQQCAAYLDTDLVTWRKAEAASQPPGD